MRNDGTPGIAPLTNGLQIFVADAWVKINSGVANKFGVNDTYYRVRIDPALMNTKLRPLQLLLKSPAIIRYSTGTGVDATAPTAANAGVMTLEAQTFLQPVWLGPGGDLGWWALSDVTAILEYFLQMRNRPEDEVLEDG